MRAVLLAQLANKIKQAVQIVIDREYDWTDSTIFLAWLKESPSKWKTFVANRVSQIQWKQINGNTPASLKDNNLWWCGPPWLSQESYQWPSMEVVTPDIPNARKGYPNTCLVSTKTGESSVFDLTSRYSNYNRLQRITAYCLKFIRLLCERVQGRGSKSTNINKHLTTAELIEAERVLIKLVQGESFAREISELSKDKGAVKKTKLIALNPFIDTDGLLRVGGRLVHASIPYNHKHPIILPAEHNFTRILIDHEHRRLLHAGARNELNELAKLLRNDEHNEHVTNTLANEHIQWHLIPPHSPHFGGLWESAVKSVKKHLRRVIGEQRLTYEEFYTVL
ncbi:uncharacterized protein LOC144477882, partial [Augochlora pura]